MTPIRLPTAMKATKPHKYGAKKAELDGITFDSKAEARCYANLQLLAKAGRITDLQRQVTYVLAPSVQYPGARSAKPALRMVVDFTYLEDGVLVVHDVKGVETEGFKIKRHLLKSVHGLDMRLTK